MAELTLSYENPLRARLGAEFFTAVPLHPGVYFFLDDNGEPLYIGKADLLRKRLQRYASAKPGQVPDHILEMIELAQEIRWELHESGAAALSKEAELIAGLKPPFNIAGKEDVQHLFIGLRAASASSATGQMRADFRLSHNPLGAEFNCFGCFPKKGRVKAGYSALLRLLYAAGSQQERLHWPARICRASPPYEYRTELHSGWLKPLKAFLGGESDRILHALFTELMRNPAILPHQYAGLSRDLKTVREFYNSGPRYTRTLLRAEKIKRPWISQKRMARAVMNRMKTQIPSPRRFTS